MKFTWLTDIHLNFLDRNERKQFYLTIRKEKSDFVLISGDIAEAPSIADLLREMVAEVQTPIYFVLGNHDYYHGQVNEVKKQMIQLTKSEPLLKWLPACDPVFLEDSVYLVGQDGWADGQYGEYQNSSVSLNDSLLIADLFQQKIISKNALLSKMQDLADEDAKKLSENINHTIEAYHPQKIIILTHIPPFKEACLHNSQACNNDWLPYFSSKATGDVLMEMATQNPNISFLTYCGHTHCPAFYQPLKNLIVQTGGAEYYKPVLQKL